MRRLVVLALLLAAAPAAAATFMATSVEEAARASDAVVRGTVVSKTSRITRDGRGIVTDVDVAVASAWKGNPGRLVRLVVRGGRVGDVAQHVDASPTFEQGEEIVVFVTRRGPAWHVAGAALGKFRVEHGAARPSLENALVLPRQLPSGERAVGPMSVDELERRVRAAR